MNNSTTYKIPFQLTTTYKLVLENETNTLPWILEYSTPRPIGVIGLWRTNGIWKNDSIWYGGY